MTTCGKFATALTHVEARGVSELLCAAIREAELRLNTANNNYATRLPQG